MSKYHLVPVHVTPDVILGDLPIHMESQPAAGLARGSVQNLIKTPRTVGIEIKWINNKPQVKVWAATNLLPAAISIISMFDHFLWASLYFQPRKNLKHFVAALLHQDARRRRVKDSPRKSSIKRATEKINLPFLIIRQTAADRVSCLAFLCLSSIHAFIEKALVFLATIPPPDDDPPQMYSAAVKYSSHQNSPRKIRSHKLHQHNVYEIH